MNQYLLSIYEVEGQAEGSPSTPDEMQSFMARIMALEEEMDAAGAFAFGGAAPIHAADADHSRWRGLRYHSLTHQ